MRRAVKWAFPVVCENAGSSPVLVESETERPVAIVHVSNCVADCVKDCLDANRRKTRKRRRRSERLFGGLR